MVVVDTNCLLDNPELINKHETIILSPVLEEIDKHKISYNRELAYKARKAVRYIRTNKDKVKFDFANENTLTGMDDDYADNLILSYCKKHNHSLMTNDVNMQFKADALGIELVEINDVEDEDLTYTGYKEVFLTEEEINDVYNNLDANKWDLLTNEYLIILDENGNDVDALRWDGKYLTNIYSKGFSVQMFGRFKPKDFYQRAAVDSIFNNSITRLSGKAGSGKSLIGLYTAWHLIERNKFDKMIVFTNPVKTKYAESLGFYKGNRTEKLLDSQTGIMLSSKFGNKMAVEMQIQAEKLELLPFSDIRGFDTTGEQKIIVWIPEAQNSNTELMKLALQRIGENTKVIIDGDPNTQVDMDAYSIDNGMKRVSQVFRGHSSYGEIELKRIYRSEIASVADRM